LAVKIFSAAYVILRMVFCENSQYLKKINRELETCKKNCTETLKPHSEKDSRPAPAKAFIENNPGKKMRAGSLAAMAGMSVSGFRTAFKAAYGITVHAFVQQQRMLLAFELLRANYLPIKQIAAACGFDHTSHFGRAVKKYYGKTPQQLRQQAS
jgi:AraC-like DNA-binding protein